MSARKCRHCDRNASRPRQLCWRCYYTPGVKELYPPTSKFAKRGIGNYFDANPDKPKAPTDADPGSIEKIRVMSERAERGESIFHERDKYADTYEPVKLMQVKCLLDKMASNKIGDES